MKTQSKRTIAATVAASAVLAGSMLYAQDKTRAPAADKYALVSPSGIAFADFRGYEDWSVVSTARTSEVLKVIVANPIMIQAYKSGIPGNGKPFPDGARMAKVHWAAVKSETEPGNPFVPGGLANVDFMVKDSKRFSDTGGWGYAVFEYDGASGKFRPGDLSSTPPQANDAKCGFACHTLVKDKDYVFTSYQKR